MIQKIAVGTVAIYGSRLTKTALFRGREQGWGLPAWLDDIAPSLLALVISVVGAEYSNRHSPSTSR